MSAIPTKGKFCKIEIGSTVIPGVNWSLAIDPKLVDWSNFRDGRRKTATLRDATLTFSVPNDEAGSVDVTIKDGDQVTIKLYVNNAASKFFEGPFTIGPVTPKVDSQEEILRWDYTAELNGELVYPVHGGS
jgi:hypothetical protein